MKSFPIRRLAPDSAISFDDALAVEEPLEIRIEGSPIAITMRSPGHDRELAAGFLLSEGVIESASDLDIVDVRGFHRQLPGCVAEKSAAADLEGLTRHVFTSSSCGVCGKTSIDRLARQFPPIACDLRIPLEVLYGLPSVLGEAQQDFQLTGGLARGGSNDEHGKLLLHHEDVGRHNALDKVLGASLLKGEVPLSQSILLVSGQGVVRDSSKARWRNWLRGGHRSAIQSGC